MALIVLQVLIIFTISSFEFHQVKCRDFVAKYEWSPIHPTLIHWIIVSNLGQCWSLITGYNRSQ